MTNAEKIRSVTDEELSVLISEVPFCETHELCPRHMKCVLCAFEWLKQEVTDDG